MSKRTKYTLDEKYEILKFYKDGMGTVHDTITKFKISAYAFYDWGYNYERYGIDGLKESRTCKKYSKELKERAIKEYLSRKYSQKEIVEKYEITDKSVLDAWIKKYNSHREIKATTR